MFANKMKDIYTYILQSKKEGRKLFAKGIIREIIKGKRIQERKYKEIRIKAKTLLQAKLKMIKIEKEYQNESPSDR